MTTTPELGTDTNSDARPAGWRPPPARPDVPTPLQRWAPLAFLLAGVVALAVAGGWSLVVVVLAIIVMITLHELGHYLTAKWAGMKVTEFFLGFGPRIWSFRRGETEYGVKAIPAGAYVKIVGMHNLEDVDPIDEERTYRQKSYPRRLSVAVAGSAMHFLIAVVCLYSLLVFHGAQGGRLSNFMPDDELVAKTDSSTNSFVSSVEKGSPAAKAGIRVGDKIVRFDGQDVRTFGELRPLIKDAKGETVDIVVRRGGDELDLTTTIGPRHDDPSLGFLGVTADLPTTKVGPLAAIPKAGTEFGRLVGQTVTGLGQIFSPRGVGDIADQVAHPNDDGQQPEPSGGGTTSSSPPPEDRVRPISVIGLAAIGSDLLRHGWVDGVVILAAVNMFVGIFNMVPLLPLDGGHVAIATYERVRSRKGRRYFVDVAKLMPITYAVVLLLIFVGLAAMFLDIVNPVSLN